MLDREPGIKHCHESTPESNYFGRTLKDFTRREVQKFIQRISG